jgi:hypothetical protein
MEYLILLKGTILGMEKMGAKLVKINDHFVFFDIPKGSEIDDNEKLKIMKRLFKESFHLGLKVRK